MIKREFPGNKVYLFSMSWESILSAKILEKDSFAVDGVVVCGQIHLRCCARFRFLISFYEDMLENLR